MQQSQVELILGSDEIVDGSSYFVASGPVDYASVIASQGDSNNDNLPEFVFHSTSIDESQTEHTTLELFSRKLFDVSEVTVIGETVDGKIQSSTNGIPRIILDIVNISANSGAIHRWFRSRVIPSQIIGKSKTSLRRNHRSMVAVISPLPHQVHHLCSM